MTEQAWAPRWLRGEVEPASAGLLGGLTDVPLLGYGPDYGPR